MPAYVNSNNAFSTLAGNITATDTSFTLVNGTAFAVVTPGNWSFVTFQDAANNVEIMKITAHGAGGNSFSCERAQEGTVARAWIVGDVVEARFTAGTVATVDGAQTLTNKTLNVPVVKFPDGTLAAPGIFWAGEPSSGFARLAATIMAAVINGQNVMHWQPGNTFVNTGFLNLLNGAQLAFANAGGTLWTALHANSANDLYVGHGGWATTRLYGGGAGNLTVHAGGVSFAGAVTGITAAMVGLGNVANALQVFNLRAVPVYIGWNGTLELQVDTTYFGATWPISITGNAGGNAASATNAANANAVNGISGWSYANHATNPVYIWATDGSPAAQFLTQPGNLSVNFANSAGSAGSANTANTANFATTAGNGGVTSVNGMTGAVVISVPPNGGSNSSIHPDSEITMADGTTRWLRDVRVGDSVWGRNGPAIVLGMWTNTLQERSLWEVSTEEGAVVCTPGHLFPVMVNGVEAWGAPVPEMYWHNSHGRRRSVKTRRGLIDTLSTIVGDNEPVHTMESGMLILHVSGRWVPVTGLRETHVTRDFAGYTERTRRSVDTSVNKAQQVIALYLDGSKVFYADGHAVGTLA